MDRPLPVAVGIRQSSCGKRHDLLWYNHPALGKNNFLVGRKNIALLSHNDRKLNLASEISTSNQAVFWYNSLTMSRHFTPVDISNSPELVRLAEEVATTHAPRALMRNNKPLAVLIPATNTKKGRAKTQNEYAASLAVIGSWHDLDTDALIAHIYTARTKGSRSSVTS